MVDKKYDLTFPQNNIYLVEKFSNKTPINTITGLFNIHEQFNDIICKNIINKLIENNDALRIRIFEEYNKVYQKIFKYEYEDIEVIDMIGKDETEINLFLNHIAITPFKLIKNKLYDFKIIRYSENTGSIIVKLHHIISDAWTLRQVANQLVSSYNDELNNLNTKLNIPSYLEFINAEKDYIQSEKYLKDDQFWKEYFKDIKEPLRIKSTNKRLSTKAKRLSITLNKEINKKIIEYTKKNRISPYILFLATLSVYLYRTLDSDDFIIGTPVLNRSNFKEKQMMGMFVSTMPTRIKINKNINFLEFTKQLSFESLTLFRHQKYPITKIIENIRKEKRTEGNIYNIMLSYQNARSNISENNIFSSEWLFSGNIQEYINIHIMDMDNTGVLNINYDYLSDLFEDIEIKYIHSRLINIIKDIIENPDVEIDNINIMGKSELLKIEKYNNTNTKYPKDKTIIDLFEEQVERTPNNIAAIDGKTKLTYKELNERCNGFARYLSNCKNENIILNLENSIESLIAIYGILKSGNTYIPVDVSMPKERIEYIIKDSKSKYIISNNRFSNIKNIDINNIISYDTNINYSKPNELAYIIYTSGTTGNPKGVKILNKSLTNYIYWGSKVYNNKSGKIVMPLFTSIGFDLTVTTIYLPLIVGGKVIITHESILDIFNNKELNTIKLTPAHFNLINYKIKNYENIKTLIIGGEALKTAFCYNYTKYNKNISIFNEYGPTEATVGCMIYKYNKSKDKDETIKIGKPADNVKLHVLNKNRKPVPIGCEGELYISGDGLSTGYLNLPKRNEESFVNNMYKTGDAVKLEFDMNMKYIGRLDTQIKINGFRIEVDDISNIIIKNFDVKDVIVSTKKVNNVKNLCVYYVGDMFYTTKEFREKLNEKLPFYMIPNLYFKIDRIPLNTNGKVDLRRLEEIKTEIETDNKVEFLNDLEIIMCNIIKEILGIKDVNPTDNIFNLGIDSLHIIKSQLLLAGYNYTVDVQKFYEYPVIRDFCSNLLKNNNEDYYDKLDNLKQYENIDFTTANQNNKVENVMLTGATGYLGAHILKELLDNKNIKKVYCLVRGKDYIEKIRRKFSYYFEEINLENQPKLEIINGDLEQEYFNINKEVFKDIDVLINAAAIVKHNGPREQFEKGNVETVKNMIKVCIENNIILEHISTMSIAGLNISKVFDEKKFYIGQEYKINPYIETKFKAELIIFKNIKEKKLKANIYRMGNLTWRISDGRFQYNVNENAFFMRLKNIYNLKIYSDVIKNYKLEFTPVDLAAKNIMHLIINDKESVNKVYHVYNNNVLDFQAYIDALKGKNIQLKKVSNEKFIKEVKGYIVTENVLFDEILKFGDKIQVKVSNKATNLKLNNNWPKVDNQYFNNIFDYIDNGGDQADEKNKELY